LDGHKLKATKENVLHNEHHLRFTLDLSFCEYQSHIALSHTILLPLDLSQGLQIDPSQLFTNAIQLLLILFGSYQVGWKPRIAMISLASLTRFGWE
jgi:hypothetical protein